MEEEEEGSKSSTLNSLVKTIRLAFLSLFIDLPLGRPWVTLYTGRPGHIRVRVSGLSVASLTWRMSTLWRHPYDPAVRSLLSLLYRSVAST